MKKEKKDLTQANTAVKSRDKKKIFMTIGIVVACLAIVYVGFGIFFQSHFCFGTTIDGIKAGGKSVEKMEQLITEEIDSYVLNLVEREEGQESIAGDAIQIAPVFNGEVEELLNGQNGFAWVVTLFKHENLELAKVVTFDENALFLPLGNEEKAREELCNKKLPKVKHDFSIPFNVIEERVPHLFSICKLS